MDHRFVSCVAALLISLVASMANAQTPTPSPGSSGIEGVIMISPSRPGPIRKDVPSTTPARDVEFVVKKADVQVTSFKTDGEGRFRVVLPPGQYTVLRDDPGARIGRWRFEVEVKAGEVATVRWVADSGMR